jgi:hypothetical protein
MASPLARSLFFRRHGHGVPTAALLVDGGRQQWRLLFWLMEVCSGTPVFVLACAEKINL